MVSRATLLMLVIVAGCSLENREGVDLTCAELEHGRINACQDGIITSCVAGTVHYRVCPEEEICSEPWQQPNAYRCSIGENLPSGGTGGTHSGSARLDEGAIGRASRSTGDGSTTDCAGNACSLAPAEQTAQLGSGTARARGSDGTNTTTTVGMDPIAAPTRLDRQRIGGIESGNAPASWAEGTQLKKEEAL